MVGTRVTLSGWITDLFLSCRKPHLQKIKSYFPLTIVQSTLFSVFLYSILVIVHMHAPPSPLKPPDSVYHSALRCITNDKLLTHHCVLYENVGWSSSQRGAARCIFFFF